MHRLAKALPYLLLLVFIAWAAWQAAQIHELEKDTQDKAESVSVLQEQQAASWMNLVELSRITYEPPVFESNPDIPLSDDLQEQAWKLCRQNDIPYDIFMRLMYRESRYQPDALNYNKNGTYDRSLMQINDANREWLADHYGLDTNNPYDSIEAAVVILRHYLNKGYTLEESLAAYGVGEYGAMVQGKGFEAAKKLMEAVT